MLDFEKKLDEISGPRYKSKKGDADLRKQTSKSNMAKARQAKLDKMKEKEQEQEIEVTDSDECLSSSDEELVITKKPKKNTKISGGSSNDDIRIKRLEKAIYNLSIKQNKPKKTVIEKKTVINMPAQPQQQQVQPNIYKQQLLNLI